VSPGSARSQSIPTTASVQIVCSFSGASKPRRLIQTINERMAVTSTDANAPGSQARKTE
jgi:hypothetical protein